MSRLRRSMLFVPGNNPGMMSDAHIYGSDALMFDLEDSVAMREKDAARLLVFHALKTIHYGDCELVVRVNPLSTPYGKADIEAMIAGGAQVIRLPKRRARRIFWTPKPKSRKPKKNTAFRSVRRA
jgi:citrate lyase subunit beta/citryl-CoA lyase